MTIQARANMDFPHAKVQELKSLTHYNNIYKTLMQATIMDTAILNFIKASNKVNYRILKEKVEKQNVKKVYYL